MPGVLDESEWLGGEGVSGKESRLAGNVREGQRVWRPKMFCDRGRAWKESMGANKEPGTG